MVVVLKACFDDPSTGKCEFRRIAIIGDVLHSYAALRQKVSNLFPALEGKVFNLGWNDGEDDIMMSSDDELSQAVANCTDSMLKIFVRLPESDVASTEGSSSNKIHCYVTCDGCQGGIKGIRYKCCQCADYDLCSNCNTKNKHPQHDMIKLVAPVTESRAWYFNGWRKMWHEMFPFVNKCPAFRRRDNRGEREEEEAAPRMECPRDFKRFNWRRQSSPHLGSMLEQAISNVLGIDVVVDVISEGNEPSQKEKSKDESTANTSNESESKESDSKIDANNDQKPDENPIQLPACFTFKNSASDEKISGARPKANSSSPVGDAYTPPVGIFAGSRCTEDEKANGWTVIDPVNSSPVNEENIKSSEAKPQVTNSPQEPVVGPSASKESVGPSASKESVGPSAPKESVGPSAPKDDAPKVETGAATGTAFNTQFQDALANDIGKAVAHMLSMGFTNEGGWLTQLLQKKDGNIAAVLESLFSPQQQR